MAVFRRLALLFVFVLPMAPAYTFAADPVTLPGFDDVEAGVTVNFLATGPVEAEPHAMPHVVVERIELKADETIPFADAIQSIAVLDGRLVMVDDLGLNASLKEGKQTFAPAGSFSRIRASEPTTLLRARIAPPPVDITIFDDHCDPTALTRASGSTLVVKNDTNAAQPFTISSLDIDAEIPAGQTASVPLGAVEATDWEVSCGYSPRDRRPIDTVTLTISKKAPAPAITPVAEPAGTTLLYDGLLPVADDGDAIFFLAQLAIAPAGSLGEQTMPGPTVVIAGDEPVDIDRPGKPTATLSAGRSVLLPADTVATISNGGDAETTILMLGISPVPEATPEPAQPSPTAVPTEAPPAPTTPPSATTDLESFIPSHDALNAIGFWNAGIGNITSFSMTTLAGLEGTPFEDDWQQAMYFICAPDSSMPDVVQAEVEMNQFGSAANAKLIVQLTNASIQTDAKPLDPPSGSRADAITSYFVKADATGSWDAVVVLGSYGNVLVTLVVFSLDGSSSAAAEAAAIDLWMAVDATQP